MNALNELVMNELNEISIEVYNLSNMTILISCLMDEDSSVTSSVNVLSSTFHNISDQLDRIEKDIDAVIDFILNYNKKNSDNPATAAEPTK